MSNKENDMLVLTRKQGQSIRIGESEIVIVGLTSGRVRIGIIAPPHIHILRTELEQRNDDRLDELA